jgi:Asp-tRNA(Asn)/Glu-tRNA(Gln) amidotransferase C subunit
MDKNQVLDDIFNNDPFGILNVKPKTSTVKSEEERLLSSFNEINDFVEKNNKLPEPNASNISEYQLYKRLTNLREDSYKCCVLEPEDKYNILKVEVKEINSIDDIFNDDLLDILGDDSEGLFEFKHTPKDYQRAETDFVARRKPCKDFHLYEANLKAVQRDLAEGKRKLVEFNIGNLREGTYYVHNGVLFFLVKIEISREDHYKEDGTRVREDGRTKCIFENGTVSNMLKRSVEKILYSNGKAVTEHIDEVQEEFIEKFNDITDEDKEEGFIYVLRSLSTDEKIKSIEHLYKIGFSKIDVKERIKNASKEPTYLMAPVKRIVEFKCFNMNPQKLEQLLHNFFGNTCLEVDVFDEKGKRHTPREWFIAPIQVIEQAIELIISREIVNYEYDVKSTSIFRK